MRQDGLLALFALTLAAAVAVAGCGELVDLPTGERDSKRLAPGYTPCGDEPNQTHGVICHPNQYCSDQFFATCSTGCLSEDNCTEEQTCYKEDGEDVGTCVDNDDLEDGEIDDGLDPGYTSCGDGYSETTCHPNQYCADDDWGDCELGCLSGENCTDDQRCEKESGEDVGTCVEKQDE